MRHLAILAAILSITVCANAGMFIDVADNTLAPGENTTISIWRWDYMGEPWGQSYFFGLTSDSMGTLNIDSVQSIFPELPITVQIWDPIEIPGMKDPILSFSFADLPPNPPQNPQGMLINNIVMHCDGPGNVTMLLLDQDWNIVDSKTVTQTPEPMTIALIGLGAMILRRRRPV